MGRTGPDGEGRNALLSPSITSTQSVDTLLGRAVALTPAWTNDSPSISSSHAQCGRVLSRATKVAPERCSYVLSRCCSAGGAGRPVMGHSSEGELLSGHAMPVMVSSGGPADRFP